jgi:hypothetical protein
MQCACIPAPGKSAHDFHIGVPVFFCLFPAGTIAGAGVEPGSMFVPVTMLVVGF